MQGDATKCLAHCLAHGSVHDMWAIISGLVFVRYRAKCFSLIALYNFFFFKIPPLISSPLTLFLFIYFIHLWLCWVFVSVRGLPLAAASGGHSSSRCAGLSLSRPLLLWSTGSRRAGSVVVAHGPIVAPRHVGSSQTRARTRVPCIGRQIPNHRATREAQYIIFYNRSNYDYPHYRGGNWDHQLGGLCNLLRISAAGIPVQVYLTLKSVYALNNHTWQLGRLRVSEAVALWEGPWTWGRASSVSR